MPPKEPKQKPAKPYDACDLTHKSWFVFYGEHADGCQPGFMVREGLENAERSAKLMEDCGYKYTEIRRCSDVGAFVH